MDNPDGVPELPAGVSPFYRMVDYLFAVVLQDCGNRPGQDDAISTLRGRHEVFVRRFARFLAHPDIQQMYIEFALESLERLKGIIDPGDSGSRDTAIADETEYINAGLESLEKFCRDRHPD